jgi:trk system potassium uptake protein TrkA
MKIMVIGAGQVGSTIVEALHGAHELTVIDEDAARLGPISHGFDVVTVAGNGASRTVLQDAGIKDTDLVIACTSRDEINIVASMLSKSLAPNAKTIVRATNTEYLEAWQERHLDVDFIVSSELETALAVSRTIGVPAAIQTDVFAGGQVQIVEFDVPAVATAPEIINVALRDAPLPRDARVAGIIRDGEAMLPRGRDEIRPGDRIVVIGSPYAAREWSALMTTTKKKRPVEGVVVFGGGRIGTAVARVLLQEGISVRIIESNVERAREVSELVPGARVFHAKGLDPDFFERERIGDAQAAVFAMRDDAKILYAAVLAKLHGVGFTIAVTHDAASIEVFKAAGIDVAINPRLLTAEEIVRFAHDPRTQQVAMLDSDRFEVLDVITRPGSQYVGTEFANMPIGGAVIGAIVREGKALFPHGEDMLLAGDRVIVFTESARAREVEEAL